MREKSGNSQSRGLRQHFLVWIVLGRGVICVFFRKVSQIGKKGEKTEKIGVNLRKTCGNFDEVMKAVGKVDEITKACRKCSNIDESLTCSGSVVPVVSRCCALDDDGCGVGCEEVFVVAQSSFLDDGTVFDGDVGIGEGARDTEADCFRVEGVFLEGGQVGDECSVEVVGVNAGP